MDVSDRRMQVQLTQEAKIASDLILIGAIFAVVGFVSALILAQGGKDMLPVCGIDAVCPCGAKALQSWRAGFGRFTGKSFLRGVLPIRKLSRRAGERETEPSYISQRGGDVCRLTGGTRPSPGKIFHIILPPQTRHSTRRASSPTIPRGDLRALPAPAQGSKPLRIPFWGTATVSPAAPVSQPPQADGPCSWAVCRVCA